MTAPASSSTPQQPAPAPERKRANVLIPRRVVCTHCGDLGWYYRDVPLGDLAFGQAQRCPCQSDADKMHRYHRAQAASNLSDAMLARYAAPLEVMPGIRKAADRCRQFGARPSGWLYLHGPRGTGKTHLMVSIARNLLHTTASPLFVIVPDWLDYLREGYDAGDSDGCSRRMRQAQDIPVLLLDDLGAENTTAWAHEKLFQLINYRYNNYLPMVISSNIAPSQLEPRIGSRLQDTSICELLPLVGGDYRQRAVSAKGA